MSISLLMVDIEKLSHTIIIFIKVMPYIQTSAQQKIRDKIVLQVVQVYEESPRFYCLGDQN